jgi:tetratricopeptide (TPR) repeat protein
MAHVFISYSHVDDKFRKALRPQLKPLEQRNLITVWDDKAIDAGTEWRPQIIENLEKADIVVLLLSANFIASDFCYEIEMKRALDRRSRGEAEVIPVVVRKFLMTDLPFTGLQCLPEGLRPIEKWQHPADAWTAVAEAVGKAVGRLKPRTPDTIDNLPSRNLHFTGRDALLERVRRLLEGGRVALTALHGLGGIGKSQTALEYAWRHKADYCVVWWLRAEREETLLSDLAALAVRLGARETNDLGAMAKQGLDLIEGKDGWLLVYDNVVTEKAVSDWLPRRGGHVLMTSRDAVWQRVASLPVDVMSPSEAETFLTQRTGTTDGAAALAEALGRLPLALEQAAAFMAGCGWGCGQYLDVFRRRKADLLKRGTPADYPDTVATTWELSFAEVGKRSEAAAQLLILAAFLAPDDIPLDLLAEGADKLPSPLKEALTDDIARGDMVAALRHWSLVTARDDNIGLHRLVQDVVRGRLEPAMRAQWAGWTVECLWEAFPFKEKVFATWAPSRRLLAHGEAAAAHVQAGDPAGRVTAQLLFYVGHCLYVFGLYARAEAAQRGALILAERYWPASSPALAACLNGLAVTLISQGGYEEAKPLIERALAVAEAALGADHVHVAAGASNLGGLLKNLGDFAGARAAFERALRIKEAAYGPDHPEVATTANNLAVVLSDAGDLAVAKALSERTLAIVEAKLDPSHPIIALHAHNLGTTLWKIGDRVGARPLLARAVAIAIATDSLGPNHPYTQLYAASLCKFDAESSSPVDGGSAS